MTGPTLRRHRDARLLLVGQAASRVGDRALYLALGIWIVGITHEPGFVGLTFFVLALPSLAGPLAGMLVDRVRRRPLLVGADLVVAGLLPLLLLVHDRGGLWLAYLVVFVYGASGLVFSAGQSALLTTLLPEDLLAPANGVLGAVDEVSRLTAPLVGAGLFVVGGIGLVVALDAGTFLVSALCLLAVRAREPRPVPAVDGWRAEIAGGLRHVWSTGPLRRVVGGLGLLLVFVGLLESAFFALVLHGLHRPASFVGVLSATQAVGAIGGALLAGRRLRRGDGSRVFAVSALAAGVGTGLAAPALLPLAVVGIALSGAGFAGALVAYATTIQRQTPPALQGRVYAAAETVAATPQVLSIAAGAALVGVVGFRPLYVATAVGSLLVAGVVWVTAGARSETIRSWRASRRATVRASR